MWKNSNDDFLFDCYEKIISYTEDGVINSYENKYFLDDNLVKLETLIGNYKDYYIYTYDNHGNIIQIQTVDSKITQEFDQNNKIVLFSRYDKSEGTKYTEKYLYNDTLLIEVVRVYEYDYSDTSRYFYNTNNKLDSIIEKRVSTYYRYNVLGDSIIKEYDGIVGFIQVEKKHEGHLVYLETISFNTIGEIEQRELKTWEYLDGRLEKNTFQHCYRMEECYISENSFSIMMIVK